MNLVVMLTIAALTIYQLQRNSVESAVLNVYLPVMMLIPTFYGYRIPHLPGFTCQVPALIPIMVVVLSSRMEGFTFKRMDLWVLLFAWASAHSEFLNTGFGNGVFNFWESVQDAILPYLLGRVILEQPRFREKFVKRLVVLIFAVAVLSTFEFVTGKNIFYIIGRRVFASQFIWDNQPRYGFIRIKGSFPGAINAGLIFLIGIFMALWLRFNNRYNSVLPEKKYLGLRSSTWLVLGIIAGSAMTISRGPWLGVMVGFLISRIGKAKNIPRAVVLTVVICGVGALIAQKKAAEYTDVTDDSSTGASTISETQGSALYRKKAFELYAEIADKGGYFGWGMSTFPRVKGLDSIDNEYLLIRVTQGKIGYWLFMLMNLETAIAIIGSIRRSTNRIDTYFYFCLGGAIAGFMASISTVFVTGQTSFLMFIFYGWAQSLRQTAQQHELAQPASTQRFAFKRVFA
jgi:hypothetical protein